MKRAFIVFFSVFSNVVDPHYLHLQISVHRFWQTIILFKIENPNTSQCIIATKTFTNFPVFTSNSTSLERLICFYMQSYSFFFLYLIVRKRFWEQKKKKKLILSVSMRSMPIMKPITKPNVIRSLLMLIWNLHPSASPKDIIIAITK